MDVPTMQPHFVLLPFMAQGHMIPMIDMARLLAQRGVIITILTKRLNANRFKNVVDHAIETGLKIQVVHLYFPSVEAGLPEGCENFDMLPSMDLGLKFFDAEQFINERLIVNVIKTGVKAGTESPVMFGEEEKLGKTSKQR
ncbi:hypothetical protein R3W88_027638 [Solanum pinnatisectum]|uniref:Uncharacterized protein n=1 Tax=Solanum pinnatisectum TaxID=50273 RepID=A0AAV9LHT9_9SOLN|nr:hypothetical protein R3W88_027638 [Solanum pinnatisectum]